MSPTVVLLSELEQEFLMWRMEDTCGLEKKYFTILHLYIYTGNKENKFSGFGLFCFVLLFFFSFLGFFLKQCDVFVMISED